MLAQDGLVNADTLDADAIAAMIGHILASFRTN